MRVAGRPAAPPPRRVAPLRYASTRQKRPTRDHPMTDYRIVPKTVLRDRLRHELDGLLDEDIVVTSRGRPIAVVVSLTRWNAIQDKIERLEEAIELQDLGESVLPLPGRWKADAGPIGRA